MGSSSNRAMVAKTARATSQRVAYATENASLAPSNKPAMREVSARVSMFAEHFDCIKVCKTGAARNAGELQRKKAGGLPMGQQFTNAAKTDVRRGGIFNDASKGWNI